MKKTSRLVIREDARLKRTISALAKKMDITSTDFLRMVIRNGAKFYSKKLGIPYLAAYDVAYDVIESTLEKVRAGEHVEINDEELKKLEDKMAGIK